MKNSIKIFTLLTALFLFAINCSATEPVESREFFPKFHVTSTLISVEPCLSKEGDIQGYSATVQVNLIVTLDIGQFLVAAQQVNIPCGTVIDHNMTRPDFDDITTLKGASESVLLITDYLDENDENDVMFNEIKKNLHNTINSIKK